MADSVVWAPMGWKWPPTWQMWVPKTLYGARGWDIDGAIPVPVIVEGPQLGAVYAWRGPRLYCVNCPQAIGNAKH
jgi:hypothetical protein